MELERLKEIGLSEGQIRVYSAILELGIATLNKIHEKTGIERRNIYDILNKLIEKGFVSYILEKGKHTYQCTHPNKILEEVENKEKALRELKEKFPQIKGLFETSKPAIRAEVYRGDEAMKSLLNEILECKESYWLGGNNFNQRESISPTMVIWFGHWMKRRAEKKHMMYDIIERSPTVLEGIDPNNIEKQKKDYMKICWMPEGMHKPMVIIIFGNKVAQVLWAKQSFAFVIESKEIRDSYMKYFNYFWKEPWQ
ncbi:MAG: helix-turn-helix domain-containing protein [Nanoarchaeota archaeon]|nr:helix-turn-helix domain-containing protein [Nanoarchaeota archaeon]